MVTVGFTLYYPYIMCNTTIQLGGTGGMNHYMFGVCAYIQEKYIIDDTVILRTVSGSNYVGAALLSEFSVYSIWRLWSKRLDHLVISRPWTGLWYMIHMVRHHSQQILSSIPTNKRHQHYIRICSLSHMSTRWVNDNKDDDTYLSAILAGGFVPLICGWLWTNYMGEKCIDGAISLPFHRRREIRNKDREISVSVWNCPDTSMLQILNMVVQGIWSRRKHHKDQFKRGYSYADSVLRPRLDLLLERRTTPPIFINISGSLEWDISNKTFR